MPPTPSGFVLPVVSIHFRAPDWYASSAAATAASVNLTTALYVVDNSGELADRSSALPPDVRVIGTESNAGYAGGANLGIRQVLSDHPDAPFVAICSHDFHPSPECLSLLTTTLSNDSSLGIVAPRLIAPQRSIGWGWDGRTATNIDPRPAMPSLFRCDWVSGTCMVVRTAVLRSIGGLDEGFGSYVEDLDLCLRARDAGWDVATVVDATGHGLGSVSDVRFEKKAINVVLLAAKREGRWDVAVVVLLYLWRIVRSAAHVVLPSRRGLRRRSDAANIVRSHAKALRFLAGSDVVGSYRRDPRRYEPRFHAGIDS